MSDLFDTTTAAERRAGAFSPHSLRRDAAGIRKRSYFRSLQMTCFTTKWGPNASGGRQNDRIIGCDTNIPLESNFRCTSSSNAADCTTRASARSKHGAGVNVMFCDAAGTFVSNEVAIEIWQAIGTLRGLEQATLE